MVHERQQSTVNKSARQTRELVRRLGKLTEAQAAMGWGVILLIIMLVGAIYLNQSSKVAAVGRHVQQLDYELSQIQRVNAQISREIAEAQSLSRLHEEMNRMGFVPSTAADTEYMVIPDYPEAAASPVLMPIQSEKPVRSVETMRDALGIVVRDYLDDLMRGESGE